MINLYNYQKDALNRMKNGCILCGGVGSGKSRTGLAYYYISNGGDLEAEKPQMKDPALDLYIITTARKRDTKEWEDELTPFNISNDKRNNKELNTIVIDSWNNIQKYKDIHGAFFIFDEQRVCGSGIWAKTFINIAKNNKWILLSATPGDTWQDYIPVFIANGFYKNRSEFIREHVIFSRFAKYPKIDRYLATGKLIRLRDSILINMDFDRKTTSHHEYLKTDYSMLEYKLVGKNRWNPYKNEPIQNISGLCYIWRRIVNSDPSRLNLLIDTLLDHPKAIVFYNFNYELEFIKRSVSKILPEYEIAEWNGHLHQPIPSGDKWLYLVHYSAGAEGWNCITTDTIIFYSQNYSYKIMEQSAGRIDRLNTPYSDLYYYHFTSNAPIDLAINRALKAKKSFNESAFMKW